MLIGKIVFIAKTYADMAKWNCVWCITYSNAISNFTLI